MININDMKDDFSGRLGWKSVNGLPGQFSFTPDIDTNCMRVFSSDVILRKNGRQLLGLIGIHFSDSDYPFKNRLGISTYILNIDNLRNASIISNINELSFWTDRIANAVLSLPNSTKNILHDFRVGKLGTFELEEFTETTPWHEDFFNWVASKMPT